MPWQTVLQESMRIWLVSSWLTALTYIIWIKASSDTKLSKSKLILILVSLSVTHAIFKTIVPGIAFVFLFLLLVLISVASYKLTVIKALKSITILFSILLITEIFLHILLFKVLGMQANPNNNIFWIISSTLTLLSVVTIRRKELLKSGHILLGRTPSKYKKA